MTAQFSELLKYRGEELSLFTEPLDGYLKSAACTLKFDSPYTACWRGYLGTWSIREGRLYLVELEGWTRPEFAVIEVSLQDLFPDHTDGVFADWFSGELRCANGELATYVHLGYASRYKQELFIEIRKGVVVGERIEVNDIAVPE